MRSLAHAILAIHQSMSMISTVFIMNSNYIVLSKA